MDITPLPGTASTEHVGGTVRRATTNRLIVDRETGAVDAYLPGGFVEHYPDEASAREGTGSRALLFTLAEVAEQDAYGKWLMTSRGPDDAYPALAGLAAAVERGDVAGAAKIELDFHLAQGYRQYATERPGTRLAIVQATRTVKFRTGARFVAGRRYLARIEPDGSAGIVHPRGSSLHAYSRDFVEVDA